MMDRAHPIDSASVEDSILRPVLAGIVTLFLVAMPSVASSAVMKYMSVEDLVEESTLVVRGEVAERQTFRKSDEGGVVTHTTIEVAETYLGEEHRSVTIEQWGGTIGETTHKIPGDAQFEAGEQVVVFLSEGDEADGPHYLVGLAQSKFDVVESDGSAMVVRDLSKVSIVDDGTTAEASAEGRQTWSLDSFEATLESLAYAKSHEDDTSTGTSNSTEGPDE